MGNEEAQSNRLSEEDANNLVVEHLGWAESIARSVARAWNLDWRLDGPAAEVKARELSAELYGVFPELRDGRLPIHESSGNDDADCRAAVRELLMGASLVVTREAIATGPLPDELMDYKRVVSVMASLEPVHQWLLYKVYWDGISLRNVAAEWETDGLNVMREHKVLMLYLQKSLALGKPSPAPKVRPGLKPLVTKFKTQSGKGPFTDVLASTA